MTSTTQMQPDPVAEAEAALEEAEAEVGRVEEAILDGTPGVSVADLGAAERRAQDLRSALGRVREGVRVRGEKAREDVRLARIEELTGNIKADYATGYTMILDLFASALADLTGLGTEVRVHNDGLRALNNELLTLGELPPDLDPRKDSGTIRLRDVDMDLSEIDFDHLACELVERARTAAGLPRSQFFAPPSALASDAHTAEVYGLERHVGAAVPSHGPSDRLAWLSGRMTEGQR